MTIMFPTNWTNYFFHTDFTASAVSLAGLEVSSPVTESQAQILLDILSSTDTGEGKDQWVSEGVTNNWNLANASIAYNGSNNREFATNSSYSNVLILDFSEKSTAPVKRVYLQYNVIVNDEVSE